MKRKILLFLLLGFSLLCFIGTAGAIGIYPQQDVIISANNPDMNNPVPDFLTVNYGADVQNAGLLQFDLSAITEPILSATLNLYHVYNDGSGANFGIYLNQFSWDESTVTWNSSPSYEDIPYATLSISESAYYVWRNVDITSMVTLWLDGTLDNYGLRLQRSDQLNPFIYFASSTYMSGEYTPFLEIITSPSTVPEPSSMLLLGVGLIGIAGVTRRKLKK